MMNFPKFILIWFIIILALAISIGFPPAALVTPAIATYLCQYITEKAFSRAMDVENARENTEDKNEEADPEEETSVEDTDDEESDGESADD